MAKENQQEPQEPRAAAREAAEEAREERDEDTPTYPVDLLTNGGITDYPPHVMAGALSGLPGNRKNLSIDEANAAAKAWLDSPVKEA